MTQPRTTAAILASPDAEILHYIAHGLITRPDQRWMLYDTIDVDPHVRRLAADELIELPPAGPPILTARGEDIEAMS